MFILTFSSFQIVHILMVQPVANASQSLQVPVPTQRQDLVDLDHPGAYDRSLISPRVESTWATMKVIILMKLWRFRQTLVQLSEA